jgi:transposase
MLNKIDGQRVYLACGATDMRKSIDGLAVMVQESFKLDPFSSSLYVFCNKGCNKLKILYWEHNGFWLYYRRLEKGKFMWPTTKSHPKSVGLRELHWLLDGLDLEQKTAHKKVLASIVI